MDDLTSRDEEKAREKDLKAEQDRQRDEQKAREQAAEKEVYAVCFLSFLYIIQYPFCCICLFRVPAQACARKIPEV